MWKGNKYVGLEKYSHHKAPMNRYATVKPLRRKKSKILFLINVNFGLSCNEIIFYVMLLHLGQSLASSQICWEGCREIAKTSFI